MIRRAVSHVQLSNQRQLIVKGFGFNSLQTTLLGCVDGVVESASSAGSSHRRQTAAEVDR